MVKTWRITGYALHFEDTICVDCVKFNWGPPVFDVATDFVIHHFTLCYMYNICRMLITSPPTLWAQDNSMCSFSGGLENGALKWNCSEHNHDTWCLVFTGIIFLLLHVKCTLAKESIVECEIVLQVCNVDNENLLMMLLWVEAGIVALSTAENYTNFVIIVPFFRKIWGNMLIAFLP